jgi:protein SCO1/2
LNAVVTGVRDTGLVPGKGYRLLTVSIDPRDTSALARAKRENYVGSLGGVTSGTRPWDFLSQAGPADEAQVKRLADAIGFQYRWDDKTQQFAHAAGAFVFTPDGKLSRTLTGIEFPSKDVRLALVEASEGKLGGAWDKVLLLCYHYEPGEGYTVAIMRIMRFAGLLTVLLLSALLLHFWRRERKQSGAEPKAA